MPNMGCLIGIKISNDFNVLALFWGLPELTLIKFCPIVLTVV
jgi:hypothetical protein